MQPNYARRLLCLIHMPCMRLPSPLLINLYSRVLTLLCISAHLFTYKAAFNDS